MRVLVTGASGQVGREILRQAPHSADVHAVDHQALDIGNKEAVGAVVKAFRPTLIINAAAYTAVDKAEQERERALQVNGKGPRYLAQSALTLGACRVIHLSTDYVFDGKSSRAYLPTDEPHPLNWYGETKLEGEHAVLQVLGTDGVVLRTAWVYSTHGQNFMLTMLRRMREGNPVRVVSDQLGTPTSAQSVAEATWAVAHRRALAGTFHWTDAGVASWYDFAVAVAEECAAMGLLPSAVDVKAIATEDYPTAAQRPRRSLLDSRSTAIALGLVPRHWRQNLRQVFDELRHA